MSATGTLAIEIATPAASDQPITETASVGANPSSIPTTPARRRSLAESPQPAQADMRRRAASSVAKTTTAMEDSLSTREFWLGALGLNLVFWLWALYGA